MTRSELLAYCLSKPGAWRDEPWPGDEVAKVAEKSSLSSGRLTPTHR